MLLIKFEGLLESQNLSKNEKSDQKIKFKSIEFKDVSFRYNEKSKYIFDNINLKVTEMLLLEYRESLEVEKQL